MGLLGVDPAEDGGNEALVHEAQKIIRESRLIGVRPPSPAWTCLKSPNDAWLTIGRADKRDEADRACLPHFVLLFPLPRMGEG